MTTIKEDAQAYVPKQIKNITELEAVSVSQEIKTEDRVNKDGEGYTISFVSIAGEEYRVPNSVREQIKNILKVQPDLKTIKVTSTGEFLKKKYQVVPLE